MHPQHGDAAPSDGNRVAQTSVASQPDVSEGEAWRACLFAIQKKLAAKAFEDDLIPHLIELEDWIGSATSEQLNPLLFRALADDVGLSERGLLLVALSASGDPRTKRILAEGLAKQRDAALAVAYSLVLTDTRIRMSSELRADFWRGAFLEAELGELLAPDYERRYHLRRLGLKDTEELPNTGFMARLPGGTFHNQVVKPETGPLKVALLDYIDRGSNSIASKEIIFLVPWDSEFATVGQRVYQDTARPLHLRQRALEGYTQTGDPGVLNSLLLWAKSEYDPLLIRVVGTGLAMQGSLSAKKPEIFEAFGRILTFHGGNSEVVNHTLYHIAVLDTRDAADILRQVAHSGPTRLVELEAINALGSCSNSSRTVKERAETLLTIMASSDMEKRVATAHAINKLHGHITNRDLLQAAMDGLTNLRNIAPREEWEAIDFIIANVKKRLK